MTDDEYRRVKKIAPTIKKLELRSLMRALESMADEVDIEEDFTNNNIIFEFGDEIIPGDDVGESVVPQEDLVIYENDVIDSNDSVMEMRLDTRTVPEDYSTMMMISVLKYIGIDSTKYNSRFEFFPYLRQNKFISEYGELVRDGENVSIEFPNVGYEMFSTQFLHNLGIFQENNQIITLNSVSHVAYTGRPLMSGTEFIVFRATIAERIVYYCWDNEGIEEIDIDYMCSGIKKNNTYYIYHREVFCEKMPQNFVYMIHQYITTALFGDTDNMGYLILIDGVDYVIPRQRQIVLQLKGQYMCDRNDQMYKVDFAARDKGLYMVDNMGSCFYICETMRVPDSTSVVYRMFTKVMDVQFFLNHFPVPEAERTFIGAASVNVEVVRNRVDMVLALRRKLVPFMYRDETGTSKNSVVMSSVNKRHCMILDSYAASKRPGTFYVANTPYLNRKKLKPTIVVDRMEDTVRYRYYSNNREKKSRRFEIKRVRNNKTGKIVDITLRENRDRRAIALWGESKNKIFRIFSEYKNRVRNIK